MDKIKLDRLKLLKQLEKLLEGPLIVLGFIWLALLIVELLNGTNHLLNTIGTVIWIIFIIDFLIKLIIAPAKGKYLKTNVLTIISLVVPAFRVLRIFRIIRFVRFARGMRLVKVLGSLNRGIRSLSRVMKRRAIGYVLLMAIIITFAGAAGMYAFERDAPDGFSDYGTALWWTTMIMTTLGSDYWPVTLEGRILCIVLSVFAFAIFGYITATIATFFIGQDANDANGELAGSADVKELKKELAELRKSIELLTSQLQSSGPKL
jgi:voltage-gated potassium channel